MAKVLNEKYGLKVTDVHVFIVDKKGNNESGILAIAEVEFNNVLMVGSLRLFKSIDGLYYFNFPRNPQSKRNRSYSFIKDEAAREEVLAEIVSEYSRELRNSHEPAKA